MPRLYALKCPPSGVPMHGFPNPEKYPERFKSWVTIAGGNPECVADYESFQKKRLCDKQVCMSPLPMQSPILRSIRRDLESWVTIAGGNPESVADESFQKRDCVTNKCV